MTGLPPAEYLAAAFADADPLQATAPENLRIAELRAVRFVLREDRPASIRVPLVEPLNIWRDKVMALMPASEGLVLYRNGGAEADGADLPAAE